MAAKKNAKIPERQEAMMPTLDDWHPNHVLVNHPSGLTGGVKVSFIELLPFRKLPIMWRVCVWGNDDCGMEQDYEERTDALTMYNLITSWETVDKYELTKYGFVYC
jgi:hypothetical protein